MAVTRDLDFDLGPRVDSGDDAGQIPHRVERLAGERGDDVAGAQTRPGGGTVRHHRCDQRALRLVEAERLGQGLVDPLDGYPQPAAIDPAVVAE